MSRTTDVTFECIEGFHNIKTDEVKDGDRIIKGRRRRERLNAFCEGEPEVWTEEMARRSEEILLKYSLFHREWPSRDSDGEDQ
mmetsp:Transcript_9400/g.14427  ORF Transcript_9400/g.14427 Transcript_9400/m.14427 type:complete len:83 (-) Transcript_9400:301-549(-)